MTWRDWFRPEDSAPREGLLQTRNELARVVDGWIAAQGATTPAEIRGLPAVAGARRLIASTIDQLPMVVTRGDPPLWLRSPRAYGGQLDAGDLVQHAIDSMILHGRAFWRVTCASAGEAPSWQIEALDPQYVQARRRTDGIVGRSFLLAGEELPEVPVSLSLAVKGRVYILHIPYVVTVECPEGTTPLLESAQALHGYVTTERHIAEMFDQGTWQGGVLSTAHDITVTQATTWQDMFITSRRSGKIPVLGNGLEYRNESPNSRDLQMVEARMFNQSAVWALLGIPQAYMGSSMMGGQSSLSYSNAQDNRRQFADNCLRTFTTQIEDAVSRLLPSGRNTEEDMRAVFDYSEWEGRDAGAPAEG